MSELKICRICLRTEAKGYKYDRFQLKSFYEEVIALKVNDSDGLPQWFCFECAMILHNFHKFKEKCYIGQKVLRELLWKGPITYEAIYKVDHTIKPLKPMFKTITISEQVKISTINDIEIESNIKIEDATRKELQYIDEDHIISNFIKDRGQLKLNMETANENMLNIENNGFESSDDIQSNSLNMIAKQNSPISVIAEDRNIIRLKSEDMSSNCKDLEIGISLKQFGNKYLNDGNWKKVNLTEDEAVKEFRAKAEDPKYLDAAYKCRNCFKGFSKRDMLNRHVQTRHSEELGPYECRLCRMRFKWNCHLRKHTQQHYTSYECLRCHIVFHLDSSALLHEEYHSGTTKKCGYCNEEFRHTTTYYTHLRTHRSAHVCARCGAAFVSAAGLRQHRRRAHAHRAESEDSEDDEVTDTFCERCDIRFETRKAYEEHLFHSAMHAEFIKKEQHDDDIAPTKKILGKRLRAKITKELRKRNIWQRSLWFGAECARAGAQEHVAWDDARNRKSRDVRQKKRAFNRAAKSCKKATCFVPSGKTDLEPSIPVKGKRRKRIKRKHRKPSTCHQCGKHFETQAACMKHHLAEHPRTSFYAQADRHICELCGASLAPGSVAVHKNMHSREKVHTCGSCGRQFHSGVGLKRHLVTHTGEKPFGCSLCDKRFTQSNSMKLHYRTFHLKQPYPKRTRKKKKDQQNQSTEQEDSYEESDSLPEPEMEPAAPEVLPIEPVIIDNEHVTERMEVENMHYLTLG